MNEIHVPYIPNLQTLTSCEIDDVLSALSVCGDVDCVNWQTYPAHPETTLRLAHSDTMLFVRFDVKGNGLRAMHTHDMEHVNEDSCVEFFVATADGTHYYNIEFNCMGVCNASRRISKTEDVHRLTADELQQVVRYSSIGQEWTPLTTFEPFDNQNGEYAWSLTIGIPMRWLGVTEQMLTHPVPLRANFYKCGDLTSEPHYLSWNPITSPLPNFHLPASFGKLIIDSNNPQDPQVSNYYSHYS